MPAAASFGRWRNRRKFQGLESALLQMGRACWEVGEEQGLWRWPEACWTPLPRDQKGQKAKIQCLPLPVIALALSRCLPREHRYVAQIFLPHMHLFTVAGEGLKRKRKKMYKMSPLLLPPILISSKRVRGLNIILNKKEAHLVLTTDLKAVSLRCDSRQPSPTSV